MLKKVRHIPLSYKEACKRVYIPQPLNQETQVSTPENLSAANTIVCNEIVNSNPTKSLS